MENSVEKASDDILSRCCTKADDVGESGANLLIFSSSFVSVPPPKDKIVLMTDEKGIFLSRVKSFSG